MIRTGPTRLAATLLAVAALVLVAAPLRAQPLTERTPNLAGAWVTSPGNLHFQFAHRFQTAGTDADITDIFGDAVIVNYPTFDLALGLFDGGMAGFRYSSRSIGTGSRNEWQPYLKYAPLRGVGDGSLALALTGAWNSANKSLDGELAAETRAGPFLFSGAVRGFTDVFEVEEDSSGAAMALAGGAGFRINRYITLAGDIAQVVAGPDADPAWSGGIHIGIPFTPHTFSIIATNVASGTISGSSAGSGTFIPDDTSAPVYWGFEFTVPFSGFARWGRIFKPDDDPAEMAAAPSGTRVLEVEIAQVSYRQSEIRVPPGTTVRWINRDPIGHTVTGDDGSWGSDMIGPGEIYEMRFDAEGEFPFHCIPHPFMTGVVIVERG
ncbi:MAG: cupredoxin family copper-binding protein [Gemmatimonadota bacterium]|nr:cupredoxin family copper-binding protein [Gemmatimonadota bacterium]